METVFFNPDQTGKSHTKDGAFTLCGRLIPVHATEEGSNKKPTCQLCIDLLEDEDLKPQTLKR